MLKMVNEKDYRNSHQSSDARRFGVLDGQSNKEEGKFGLSLCTITKYFGTHSSAFSATCNSLHSAKYDTQPNQTNQFGVRPLVLSRCRHGRTALTTVSTHSATSFIRKYKMPNLIKPHIVTEMGIKIQLWIRAIGCSTTFHIAAKDMNNSMLDFFCHRNKVHVVAASRGTFNLQARIALRG